ncbi:hypothetical protein [Rhodococcus sp. IEGM 1408]|uniref:hypothetical protein n=1 Tax=Rhodococcus sp. IEGM 1408 TaxID=3082220 RepID=UPI002952B1C5|nr:hypothetical protein [Rhodococcus sp. IEGM 1408]MDV8003057.1 hypothetical protein [Rhodococcus sp. IEGM 1408]
MTATVTRYLASAAMVLALGASGACASDNEEMASSNRGGGEQDGQTSVENVFIVPAYMISCELQVDAPAQLSFTAINGSATEEETLSMISTPAASSVEIDAPPEALTIAPEASIAAGQPVENLDEPTAPDQPFSAFLVGLDDGVVPGTSVPVTFTFERAGDITLNVAVDACPNQAN